jgi:hypothetical protein
MLRGIPYPDFLPTGATFITENWVKMYAVI